MNLYSCPTCWERKCNCPSVPVNNSLSIGQLESQLAQSRKETAVLMGAVIAAGFQPQLVDGKMKLVPLED